MTAVTSARGGPDRLTNGLQQLVLTAAPATTGRSLVSWSALGADVV